MSTPGEEETFGPDVEGTDHEARERRDALSADLEAFGRAGTEEVLNGLLDRLETAPVAEHAEIYDNLHSQLRALLDRDPSALPSGLVPSQESAAPGEDHGSDTA
ncbi:hypothetical protein [Curtobacterium sp. S6]|uniref:hypothetical protein n=1 Tax=Curtobacterium sp. S6 TaxID=1479623 RepID=UPI0004A9F04B|nr:hypothetical protein [Curtobacterium sp. S6]